ncbi:hypothetical protein [Streptomyces sp. NPDC059209]|uniref:hypothetical protein n=1 Tax=Streptomyces sp. NPDC059209 TaxID=3346769 RepID=UPI0036A14B67
MDRRLRARHLAWAFGTAAPVTTLTATTASAAAERHGRGAPLPEWSDEFGYGYGADPAVPDRDKGRPAGGGPDRCRPGHGDNARRCDVNTRVVGGAPRMTGEANGDTGRPATAPDNGRQYRPPHYPHAEDVPVRQECARECGVDLSRWHGVAIGWTPEHLRGFIDGKEWLGFSGGANANADRDLTQCAPPMRSPVHDLRDNESAR